MSASAGPDIITDGLVLCLDAANRKSYPGSGNTWRDLSGRGNNGTLTNGPTFNSANGGSIVFDGVNDFVNLGNKFNTISGTIDFWVRLNITINSSSTNINYRPFGKATNYECRWNNSSAFGPVGTLGIDFGITTGPVISNQNTWFRGVWYNIVFNWNSSLNISNLYIQSVLDKISTAPSVVGVGGNFSVGATGGGTSGFINGNIALFKIYNRALTPQEVLQNYNATKGRFGLA